MTETLIPHHFQPRPEPKRRLGRSKKQLRPVVKFDGRVFVAHFEGRINRFFGATAQEAENNLQVGGL
jgi:hypothetical protein